MHLTTAYATAVVEGDILAGRLVRLACERHLKDLQTGAERGLHFDEEAANRAFRFFGQLRLGKGRGAGGHFRLEPWQCFIVGSLFGWKKANGFRRFTSAYIEVARKNGKSTLLAGAALYMLGLDGEGAPEVYSAATKRDQAKIVFSEARRLARSVPALRKLFDIKENVIFHRPSDGEFRALSSDAQTQDGLNPHCTVIDELHAHKTRDLVDVIESAEGSRDQPLTLIITTAGSSSDKAAVCWEKRTYGEEVVKGNFDDDTTFVYIAGLDDGDDWKDESVWIKANPNLGVSVTLDVLKRQRDQALAKPARQSEFRRKRCNQWLEVESRWFETEALDRNRAPFILSDVAGRRPVCTLDLSSKTDLTSLCLTWGDDGNDREPWRFLQRYFCPEVGVVARSENDGVPYLQWKEAGHLIATPGARVDYDRVLEEIRALRDEHGFEVIGVDPWNAQAIANQLEKDGFEVFEYRQGMPSFSGPSKEFEALIADGRFCHDGNPITDWMLGNVSVRVDGKENYMPFKASQKLRVDGVMTMIMGVGLIHAGVSKEPDSKRVSISAGFYERA